MQATDRLLAQIGELRDDIHRRDANVLQAAGRSRLKPHQTIGSTLQGSFGHVGEIDAIVALRERLGQ